MTVKHGFQDRRKIRAESHWKLWCGMSVFIALQNNKYSVTKFRTMKLKVLYHFVKIKQSELRSMATEIVIITTCVISLIWQHISTTRGHLQGWRWPCDVETCCQIKDTALTSCTDGNLFPVTSNTSRFQWPLGLRRRSSAPRLLRLWVRIPPGAWMFVCCECYVLCRKTVRKQVKINRSNRWATPEATTPLAKTKSE